MAAVNAAIRDRLDATHSELHVLDIAAPSLSRGLLARLSRLPRLWSAMLSLIFRAECGQTLYMSVSGGLGQAYEICFLVVARLRRMRIFLHHHSFAYLDSRKLLTAVMITLAGKEASHMVLSPHMKHRLQVGYGASRVVPVSNAIFFFNAGEYSELERSDLKTIGFLANIAVEKGIFEFLDLCAECQDRGLKVRARLAGPFQDAQTERAVRTRLAMLPNVEYVGPKYADEKVVFFQNLDCFVFPSRYVHEAEPITVHEAMRQCCPVIAYGRGCIPEVVSEDCGRIIEPSQPFVPEALAQISAWLDDPLAFKVASKGAIERFAQTYKESQARWQALRAELTGDDIGSWY